MDAEKGLHMKESAVVTEVQTSTVEDPELRPGNKIHYATAAIDILIALLPLYFVVFAILASLRDNTLASSFRNMAIFKMAAFVC